MKPRFWPLPALLLGLALTVPVLGQQLLRVHGVVRAPDERPVEGAEVRLFLADGSAGEALITTSDAEGAWKLGVPTSGRWEIEIRADGFLESTGWVQALESRPTPLVEVELRSLDEGTPAFLEGNRVTIQRWIERGNSLLEQGRTAEARAEYQKAVRDLPIEEHPALLQAISRTHFLELDYDAAVLALVEALRITPNDTSLRQLFTVLMQELGREDEVDTTLAEATSAGNERPAGAAVGTTPAIQRPPIEQTPTAGRTGHYRVRFAERHPLSDMDTYLERYGFTAEEIEPWDAAMGRYDLAEESFDVVVPEACADGESCGLFVFVSPTPFGGFTKDEIAEVLAARRLIWIGPDNVGNGRSAWYRVHLALDAVHNTAQLYEIDPERTYISGYSGGGRIASSMALLYPEVFSGGFFFYGTDWYEPLPVPYAPGNLWPARFLAPGKRQLRRLKSDARLVFLTGSRDFNRPQTKAAYRRAVDEGYARATYLEIPGADHYFGIDGEWLERGLEALDGAQ